MSFLQGLGAVAGGVDQTLGPLLQQYQQNVATGQGIAAMYGGLPQQQQGGGGASPLQSLMGSGPPNVPVNAPETPQLGQGGTAQSPMPQPSAVPVTPPSMPTPAPAIPSGQPRTAVGVPPPQPQGQPASTPSPQPAPAQQSAELQQQAQTRRQPDLTQFNGMFDFNHLMHNLVQTPGMNYEKLGKIANSRTFENMLNQQGLQQFRMLNLGIHEQNAQTAETRTAQQAEEFRAKMEALDKKSEIMNKNHALDRQEQQIERQYTQQSQRLIFLPADQQKAEAEKLDKAYNDNMEKLNKQRDAIDKEGKDTESQGGGSSGGDDKSVSIQRAKEALAKHPDKKAEIIKRVKDAYPDADTAGW